MELVFNGVIAVILVIFFAESTKIGGITVSNDKIGANGFPQMIIIVSLILLVYLTFKSVKNKNKNDGKEEFNFKEKGILTMILSIGLLGAYIFTLNIIGFILGTFFFSIIAAKVMGFDNNLKNIVFSIVLTASITIVFGKVFFVALPRGVGILRELSYLIY